MKIGIIWDLDGTLLDTLEDLHDAVNYAVEQFGYPKRTLQEVRRDVGTGAKNLIRYSTPGLSEERLEEVLQVFRKYYNAHNQIKTKPYDGIMKVLEELGKKYPMAIVSNKPDNAVKPMCKAYFGDIFAMGEVAEYPRKPAPDMVYKAMEEIGVEKCIYVGDSEVDVLTAANANAPCLSVLWGFRDRDILEEAGGKYFCQKPELLQAAIEEIIGEMVC